MLSICCKVMLTYEEIKKDPPRITKIKPLIINVLYVKEE